MSWSNAELPDQTGRTFVVTGANSGLGRATSRALARAGGHVVMTARDPGRGETALREVAATPGLRGSVELRALDLADLASVRAFAETVTEPVHALHNNAGVMATPRRRTADGFELQLGTNHLGHFALTMLLLPRITDRVITLSSIGHRGGRIVLDDLSWERRRYSRWGAYGQSKLANLLFTLELQRRLQVAGSPVLSLAAHPGFSSTNLFTNLGPMSVLAGATVKLFGQSEDAGAATQLYAATQDLPGGSYVGPAGAGEARGNPTLVGRSSAASDPVMARRLWEESERLTGCSWPLD